MPECAIGAGRSQIMELHLGLDTTHKITYTVIAMAGCERLIEPVELGFGLGLGLGSGLGLRPHRSHGVWHKLFQ